MLRFKPEHEEFFEAAAKAGQKQRDVAIAFALKWPLYNPSTRDSIHSMEPQTVEKNERAYLDRIVSAYKKRRAELNVAQRTRAADAAAAPVVGPIKAVFADCVTNEPVSVPVLVTGEFVTLNTDTGSASPTLVTLPAVLGIHCGLAPGPCVDST